MDELERLKLIAEELHLMRADMERMGNAIAVGQITAADVMQYIGKANLAQCRAVIDILAVRVSDIVGSARELEDASASIAREIEGYAP